MNLVWVNLDMRVESVGEGGNLGGRGIIRLVFLEEVLEVVLGREFFILGNGFF